MATRSFIALKTEDNLFKGIYCHWDGSPETMIPILEKNYDSFEKVEELLAYGAASCIKESIETCVFYHRDKGERFSFSSKVPLDILLEESKGINCEFVYIFVGGGKWIVEKI